MTGPTSTADHYWRLWFRANVRLTGFEFQQLFSRIMLASDATFRPVKPQGKKGDAGNDGYAPTSGTYYQVFAPENPKDKGAAAAKKIKSDCKKLCKWAKVAKIDHFRFVFNDHYQGTQIDIDTALAEVRASEGFTTSEPLLMGHLESIFLSLPPGQRESVAGAVMPDLAQLETVRFDDIADVLRHLVTNSDALGRPGLLVMDIDKKIVINGLSSVIGDIIRTSALQRPVVEQYFKQSGEFGRKEIQGTLRSIYEKSRDSSNHPDDVFYKVLDQLVPASKGVLQNAAFALIAFFFESCDIFEVLKK